MSEWTQLTVRVKTKDLDKTSSIMSALDNGIMIEDYSDFSLNGMYGELVDESILAADKEHARVSIFVPEEKSLVDYVSFINERLTAEKIEYEFVSETLDEEDWAESWKKYFKPIRLGRLTVLPPWEFENYNASAGEVLIPIDPGMAFGTGTHETTRLVMKIMQGEEFSGKRLLDIGTGSGILSIAAVKLGASSANAYDIDPVAVRVAKENAREYPQIKVGVSDLLSAVEPLDDGYDICTANIVAEIILRMLPDIGRYLKPNAPIILSGIVAEKEQAVVSFAEALGYRVKKRECENDWVAIMLSGRNGD